MAEGSKQGVMKKSERDIQKSLIRKTGANAIVGKAKAPISLENDDEELTLSRQLSNPFLSKDVVKKQSNPGTIAGKSEEKLPVGSTKGDALATGSNRAKVTLRTASVRSTQSAMLGAASKLQDAVPSTGPSLAGDTLTSGFSPVKSKLDSASSRITRSALLGQAASKIQDAGPSSDPSSVAGTVPSESNAAETTLGTTSAVSIKSTLPSQAASMRTPGAGNLSPSFVNTPSGQNTSNPMPGSMSLKSIQPSMQGQAPSLVASSNQKDLIIVSSRKDRKLQKASENPRFGQIRSSSKQSLVSQFSKTGQIDAVSMRSSRPSISSKTTSQRPLQVPSSSENRLEVRSTKTPGMDTSPRSFFAGRAGKSVSEMVLADGSNTTAVSGSTSRTTATNLDKSIRLLASKLSGAKMDSRLELDLHARMEMCPCPDRVVDFEEEYAGEEEQRRFLESIRSSVRSKESNHQYKPAIRNVTRSPFERKDRAARQEFLKELEHLEIAEIKRKQKLKPKKMKKYLKKEGVYQTIKSANFIADSLSDGSHGHPSVLSIATYGEEERPQPSMPSSEVSVAESDDSNDKIERFQLLRKGQSVGSRATGQQWMREDAFLEIELSEADDVEPTRRSSLSLSSSSATELLSSSSEISLRVNLDKAHIPADKKKIKARNAPYLTYKNKIDAEIQAAAKVSHEGSSQENLIIEKIATEFGEWAKENGLKPEAVEKDIIKELFQFGTMDTAANSIAVEIKELVIVPETITGGMYPELEERAALYRQILWDEMAYWKKERSMAFGQPDPFPYKRPPNHPLPLWTRSGFVPLPLSTGELLYQSLIDSESLMLERYVLWMVENPKYHRPPYLIKSGYFQKIVDKYGGKEDVIRQKSQAAKNLVNSTGKNLAGLNIGMKSELRKLKEMAKADITVHSNRKASR